MKKFNKHFKPPEPLIRLFKCGPLFEINPFTVGNQIIRRSDRIPNYKVSTAVLDLQSIKQCSEIHNIINLSIQQSSYHDSTNVKLYGYYAK